MNAICQVCESEIDRFLPVPICTPCGRKFAAEMDISTRMSRDPARIRQRKDDADQLARDLTRQRKDEADRLRIMKD